MSKVLVTGGCGFIGSHVCEFFKNKGWDVIAYDNMTKYELKRTGYSEDLARDYNWNFLKDIGIDLRKEDIRDYNTLLAAAKECDYIAHTAAQPAVTISMEDPDLDFTSNVVGTYNVLKAAKECNIPVASCATIHVYGNDINDTLREEKTRFVRDPMEIDEDEKFAQGRLTPLHASKCSGDLYVKMFIDTYNLKAASFRLTGLYGPRQFGGEDHGWVANFSIRSLIKKPIVIYGTGKQVRDILYASDAAELFYTFYEKQVPGIYNIGGGENHAISLLECIDTIGDINGEKPVVNFEEERFGDLRYFVCSTKKAEENLGWRARISPREGISELLKWIGDVKHIFS